MQLSQEDALNGGTNHLALVNDHFKGEILRSSMDHLNKEVCLVIRENMRIA